MSEAKNLELLADGVADRISEVAAIVDILEKVLESTDNNRGNSIDVWGVVIHINKVLVGIKEDSFKLYLGLRDV